MITPEPTVRMDPKTSAGRHVRFIATIEGTADFVVLSHQPLADGARELLARGYDPSELLTMRHDGKAFDSFKPAPIGQWAKVTYWESNKGRLQAMPWVPREDAIAVMPSDEKQASEGADG